MQDENRSRHPAYLGMLLAFALILGYVESLIPFSFGIPGIKLGLANFAVVLTLYQSGTKEAFLIDLLRIVLSGFLFGSLYSILYSLAGGMLSFAAMVLFRKTGWLSICGVSIAGGVFHNIGQIVIAAFIVETKGVYYYMPPLLIAGVVTGALIGILAKQIRDRLAAHQRRGEEGEV